MKIFVHCQACLRRAVLSRHIFPEDLTKRQSRVEFYLMIVFDYFLIGIVVFFTFLGYAQGFLTVLIEMGVTIATFSSFLVWRNSISSSGRVILGIFFVFVVLLVPFLLFIFSSNPYKTSPAIRFFSSVFGFAAGCFISAYITVLLHMLNIGISGLRF